MPAGNGRVVVLAWGNASAGGVDFYVRSPLAMHTDASLFTIAKLRLALSPNPFTAGGGGYYNQSLHLARGEVAVHGGGTCYEDRVASITLYVDANSDTIAVAAAARDGVTAFDIAVTLESVRPPTRFAYGPLDFQCNASSSEPDIFAPAGGLPPPALPNASIAMYHVNSVAGGDPSLFNESMRLQGLGGLLGDFHDPLDGRIFGVGVTGAAGGDGSGPALLRVGPGTLASAAPAPAFQVAVTVRVDPAARGDAAGWLAGLAVDMTLGPAPAARAAASDAWWAAFWGRSYVALPPAPPPPPRVGVFPCGGASRAAQVMSLDPASGAITLPGGLCFVPSADGTSVFGGPCGSSGVFALTPCTAGGCGAGDYWVRNAATALVLGLPGAVCPWLDVWTADDPTGALRNELWYFNSSDATLRARCTNCAAQCATLIAPGAAGGASAATGTDSPSVLGAQYARTRFVQAVQSRGVDVPIKFNGQLFTTQAGRGGPTDVDYRQWGPDHWWQNTRLPYGAQMAAGDYDTMRVLLEWVLGFVPLARARSAALLGYDSVAWTETVNAFGLYQGYEYGCAAASERPVGYPVFLEGPGDEGGWVRCVAAAVIL